MISPGDAIDDVSRVTWACSRSQVNVVATFLVLGIFCGRGRRYGICCGALPTTLRFVRHVGGSWAEVSPRVAHPLLPLPL